MIKISSNALVVAKQLASIPDEISQTMSQELYGYMEKFRLRFLRTRLSGRPGLKRGSGALARSFRTVRDSKGRVTSVSLITDSDVARTHEYGETLRGSPYLTIPLQTQYDDVDQVPDGFFFVSRKGNLLFGKREGKSLRPLFVLKESVDIPARMGLRRMFDSERDDSLLFIKDVVEKAMRKAVKQR